MKRTHEITILIRNRTEINHFAEKTNQIYQTP